MPCVAFCSRTRLPVRPRPSEGTQGVVVRVRYRITISFFFTPLICIGKMQGFWQPCFTEYLQSFSALHNQNYRCLYIFTTVFAITLSERTSFLTGIFLIFHELDLKHSPTCVRKEVGLLITLFHRLFTLILRSAQVGVVRFS